MKKIILIVIALLLTGCGEKTLTCKFKNTDGIITTRIEYKKNVILSSEAELKYTEEEKAKEYCAIYTQYSKSNTTCKNNQIVFTNVHKLSNLKKLDNLSDYKAYLEDLGYKCTSK